MASLIATQNWSIFNPNDQVCGCNCRVRNDCSLQHKSLTPGIVYQTTVTNNKDDVEKIYYGLRETAFTHEKNRNETDFCSYIWALKKDKVLPSITWKILRIVRGKPASNYCRLTLEFFLIHSIGDNRVLNKRSEFVNKWRHHNKYLIKNVKLNDSMD